MATTANTPNLIPSSAIPRLTGRMHSSAEVVVRRRRRISPESGRAIEMLGHAIEYLSDEFALECMRHKGFIPGVTHPQVVAIEMLMARNREVYFCCPEIPTIGEKLRTLLSFQGA